MNMVIILNLMETRPALLTIAMRIYCDGISPREFLDNLKNYVVGKLNGKVLYDYGGVVLEFPYQFVSIASKAYISAIGYNSSVHGSFVSLILSILDLMYPFSRMDCAFRYTEGVINSFENILEQISKERKINIEVVDIRFYDYPFRLQDIQHIRYY